MRKFESEELQHRYNTDQAFRKKVHSNEQEYYMLRKKANQMRSDQIIAESFLQKFIRKDSGPIYLMYGYLQPQPGKNTSKLTLNFMANFKPDQGERFSFVYFNQLTPSSDYFKQFKNIFLLLPHSILEKMDAFVLVKPSFYLKALNYLAIANSGELFKKCYFTVESCKELCEKLRISVQDFVSFVPEEYSQEFPEKFKRNPTLQSYRINYFGQNLTESQRFQKNEFQGTIYALISKQVYKLENYQVGELGVPVVLEMLIFYFKGKPQGLSTQGIFRKSVAIDQEQETYLQLSKRNYQFLESINNPHVIASLIKKFFNNLKEPIITFPLFKQLMEDQAAIDKRQHLKGIINRLPKLNFITLAFLIDFLKKDVIVREKENKMNANNIAICFSPCLMRSEVSSMADLVYASKSVIYSNFLITQFDYLFGNEEQRNYMFKSNVIEHNNIFQQTIREELQFDDEPEENARPFIRGTESIMMRQDGTIEEFNRGTFFMESIINQSEVKPSLKSRKLSDKIDELSNEIKEIEKRFTARKQSSSGSEAVHENFIQSRVSVKMEEDQTVLLHVQFQEEMLPINTSISSSKISLNYSNAPSQSFQPQEKSIKIIPSKHEKATTLTWQSLKKPSSKDLQL